MRKFNSLVLVFASLLLAGCPSPGLPIEFGVNLVVTLAPGVREQISSLALHVTGAETFDKAIDLDAFDGSEARLRYIPGVTSGTLVFNIEGLSGGSVVAFGTSGSVTLSADRAVNATVLVQSGSSPDMAVPDLTMPTNLAAGEPCNTTMNCATGLTCVDGVCCNQACNEACFACNLPGMVGTCSPVPVGEQPRMGHPSCGPDDVSTCKKDGFCDGAGACRLYSVTSVCKPSACDSGTNLFTPESLCNGMGTCVTPSPITCDPYKCQTALVCYGNCADNSACSGSNSCNAGSCGLKALGATCATGVECASGHCVDAVCCNNACTSDCTTCNQATTRGTCTPVPAGQDPKGKCPALTGNDAVCTPGGCDGNSPGACRRASTATQCRAGSCTGGTAVNPANCTAAGTCPALTSTVCAPYTCGANACNTDCSPSKLCVSTHYCAVDAACYMKKNLGEMCNLTTDCGSGTCVDNVCCSVTTCPTCRSCGAGGACVDTVANAADFTPNTCSGVNACNASGTCLKQINQTCGAAAECASGQCTGGRCSTGGNNTLYWQPVGFRNQLALGSWYWVWGVGNRVYVGDHTNGGTPYWIYFDTVGGTWRDQFTIPYAANSTRSELCACGYLGSLVSGSDNKLYYFANSGVSYTPDALAWTTIASYSGSNRKGEAAVAALGNLIYLAGGRGGSGGGNTNTVFSYNVTNGTLTTTGIANLPFVNWSDAVGAAAAGRFYVFGGSTNTGAGNKMAYYTPGTNMWTTIGDLPFGGGSRRAAPTFNDKIIWNTGSSTYVFDPTPNSWGTPFPNPPGANGYGLAVAGGSLYLVADVPGGIAIFRYVGPAI